MIALRSTMTAATMIAILLFSGGSYAQMTGTINDIEEAVGTSGKVNWTTGLLTAVGTGIPPAQPANSAQGRNKAELAAQAMAYRSLLESLKSVRMDSAATVENLINSNETIRSRVNGFVQGATVMDKKYLLDGSVEITMGMYLKGGLLDVLLPPKSMTPPGPGTAPLTPGTAYTGLIVDARGLGARPAMAPRVLNEDGKEVYGPAWTSREYAVREGMLGYLKDPAAALANPRVTDKPLTVKAVKVAGENRVDLVIPNDAAAKVHGMSENLGFLEKCRVIVLLDQ